MNYIYKYTEKSNPKASYIGQTTNLEERVKIGYSKCTKFYTRIRYYMDTFGISEKEVLEKYFNREILDQNVDIECADIVEQFFIQKYKTMQNGYNTIPGGRRTLKEIQNGEEISTVKKIKELKNKKVPVISKSLVYSSPVRVVLNNGEIQEYSSLKEALGNNNRFGGQLRGNPGLEIWKNVYRTSRVFKFSSGASVEFISKINHNLADSENYLLDSQKLRITFPDGYKMIYGNIYKAYRGNYKKKFKNLSLTNLKKEIINCIEKSGISFEINGMTIELVS